MPVYCRLELALRPFRPTEGAVLAHQLLFQPFKLIQFNTCDSTVGSHWEECGNGCFLVVSAQTKHCSARMAGQALFVELASHRHNKRREVVGIVQLLQSHQTTVIRHYRNFIVCCCHNSRTRCDFGHRGHPTRNWRTFFFFLGGGAAGEAPEFFMTFARRTNHLYRP